MNIDEQAANQLIAYFNSGIDFATSQAPIIGQEIIQWATFMACVGIAAGLCTLIAGSVLLYTKWSDWLSDGWDDFALLPIVIIIIGFIATSINISELAKVTLAPRLYLLEAISNLI